MIGSLSIALALLLQPEGMTRITVTGREMVGLRDRVDVIRGTCDGRPVSATITKSYRGAMARLILRAGRWTREVPAPFLNGSLFANALQSAELGCDGRRLQLHARAIRGNGRGDLVLMVQNATMDMRTGAISLSELTTYSPAQTREELN